MSLITPHLYLGDANNARDFNFLMTKGIKLIVNCAKEIPNVYTGRFKYLRLELDDVPSQNIVSALRSSSEIILQHMKKGEVVFVHCAAGISRSSSVVIYTLMLLHDWDYERTFKYVKSMHERTNPNPGFVEQLVKIQEPPTITGDEDQKDHNLHSESKTESLLDQDRIEEKDIVQSHRPASIGKLTLDSNENERPAYDHRHKGIYARIFS